MAEKARYLVTQPPGAPVPGRGFVKAGDSFTAPSEDYVPSRTFRALNEPAAAALRLLAEKLKQADEDRKRKKDKEEAPKPWEQIAPEVFVPPAKEATVQRQVVSPSDLGRLDGSKPSGSKRAADR